jgi:hypothetical protein
LNAAPTSEACVPRLFDIQMFEGDWSNSGY